jgi:catechol 2,3-dioxygenase-like lactoylglutathione lyase family enzyme
MDGPELRVAGGPVEAPMSLVYVGIRVRDLARSVRFYSEGLGLIEHGRGTMSHGGEFVELADPQTGALLELNWYPPGSPYATPYSPGEGLDHLGVEVDDADRVMARLVTLGGRVALPAWDEGGRHRIGFIEDPDGLWVEVESRLPGEGRSVGLGPG